MAKKRKKSRLFGCDFLDTFWIFKKTLKKRKNNVEVCL